MLNTSDELVEHIMLYHSGRHLHWDDSYPKYGRLFALVLLLCRKFTSEGILFSKVNIDANVIMSLQCYAECAFVLQYSSACKPHCTDVIHTFKNYIHSAKYL